MTIGLFEILGLIAALQLGLLSLFLFTHKKGNKRGNRILASFLLANALIILDVLQLSSGIFMSFPHFVLVGFSTTLLFGPQLYFYSKSTTESHFNFTIYDLLHLIPFISFWGFLTFNFYILDTETKIQLVSTRAIFSSQVTNIAYSLIHVHIIGYVLVALYAIRRSKPRPSSLATPNFNLRWLRLMLSIFLIMWSLDLARFLISNSIVLPHQLHGGFQLFSIIIYFTLVNFAVYKSLVQPEIFDESRRKYATSLLTQKEIQRLSESLQHMMQNEKPYLKSSLTLDDLAKKLATHSRHLSQVINESYRQNFFDFINRHRIEEAKYLFANNPDPKTTVLEVLYQVGFNSKSAFNSAFKKHTGLTPSEYKEKTS